MQPLVGGPARCWDSRCRDLACEPALRLGCNSTECRRRRFRSAGGNSRLIDPFINWNFGGERRILVQEVLLQIINELIRGNALEGEMIEVAFQEAIETRAAEGLFEVTQEERAFLIRDVGRAIVGIAAL